MRKVRLVVSMCVHPFNNIYSAMARTPLLGNAGVLGSVRASAQALPDPAEVLVTDTVAFFPLEPVVNSAVLRTHPV